MFEKFLNHFKCEEKISFLDIESFYEDMNGKTFGNGIYRLFAKEECAKWKKIVEECFPKYKSNIEVFGYDWLGRIFSVKKSNATVLLFEPGTGDVFDIGVDFAEFHDEELVEYSQDCLATNFFDEWFSESENYILKSTECVGYKVPLFLNGDDNIKNVEVSDMEVYWEIMMPLMQL